jgi:beta-carotene hydroxylase
MVFETTYDHHSGLFTKNKFEASRNNITSLYNFMRLNLGYHTAHHIKPGLHWSALPEYHASIESKIPNELIYAEENMLQNSKKTLLS